MQIKPFAAGSYGDDTVVIRNPETAKQELFSSEEFEVVRFIKDNEDESLLGLLLPNIGIAKKDHIMICLKVLGKLKRLGLVDIFSLTGRQPVSNTATLELEMKNDRLELLGLRTLATVFTGLAARALGWLGSAPLLLLSLALAATGFLFFPFERVEPAIRVEGLAYLKLGAVVYFTACLALFLRVAMQSAYLQAFGREALFPRITFIGPFVSPEIDRREVNLVGFRARLQMDILGILAPLALAAACTLLALAGVFSMVTAFHGFAACVLVTLLLACPILPLDGADAIHVIFRRRVLVENISQEVREIFRSRGSLSRDQLMGLVATVAWLLVWLDSLRTYWETVVSQVTEDSAAPATALHMVGAFAWMGLLLVALFLPVGFFTWVFVRDRLGGRRPRIQVDKSRVREMLTFEERMAALEKIPLFAYLNDQERLALLNEMQPAFYAHGQYLVHQGEVGQEFFVLVRGHANALFTDLKGKSIYLADLGEGDAFGEIALIDDVPRTASIVSDGGCIVMMLKKDGFARFAESMGSMDRVKTMIRLTSFFRRHPLFSKLGARDQAQLIDTFQFQTITPGDEIPEDASSFYVIYSGKVRVDTGDDSADTTLSADDCFGYANALNARYFAVDAAGLLVVKREEFHGLIWEKLVERPELFV